MADLQIYSRRISVEELLLAIKKTAIMPFRSDCSQCALAIIMQAEGVTSSIMDNNWSWQAEAWIDTEIGWEYANGFISGFDSPSLVLSSRATTRTAMGSADGKKCGAACFPELARAYAVGAA